MSGARKVVALDVAEVESSEIASLSFGAKRLPEERYHGQGA